MSKYDISLNQEERLIKKGFVKLPQLKSSFDKNQISTLIKDIDVKKTYNSKTDFHNKYQSECQINTTIKNNTPEKFIKLMRRVNPLVIPRNHKVEEALSEDNQGNLKPTIQFLEITTL